jgi:hypothetical protein
VTDDLSYVGWNGGGADPQGIEGAPPLLWGVGRHAQQRTRQQRESTATKLWLCSFFADSTADEAERLIEASAPRDFLVNPPRPTLFEAARGALPRGARVTALSKFPF